MVVTCSGESFNIGRVKLPNNFYASLIEASIIWFLVAYSLVSWSATNWESKLMTRFCTPSIFAIFKPTMKASYSDSLLEAIKPSRTACSITLPYGDLSTIPIPDPSLVDDPSIYSVQVWIFGFLSCSTTYENSRSRVPGMGWRIRLLFPFLKGKWVLFWKFILKVIRVASLFY